MGADEKNLGKIIAEAVAALPDGERKYILGYAEGVLAMADKRRADMEQGSTYEPAQDSA